MYRLGLNSLRIEFKRFNIMNRLEIEKKIKYWEKMRDFYTANDRQKKRIQRDINKYKKLLIEV
tara:strand:- start:378 stop:566 length:189 start_codon:yes stop_codon:yes gene_type:complete